MSKVVEENIVKNMTFLMKMLEKEWEESKESTKTISIAVDKIAKVKTDLSYMIQVNTGVLNSNYNRMTFKECMMMNKENQVLLRIIKKIITAIEKAKRDEIDKLSLTLDKEELKLYKELFGKKN